MKDREKGIFVSSSKIFQRWVPLYEKQFWVRVDFIFESGARSEFALAA